MIRRFSSRQGRLDHQFLREKLRGARRYKRIAGYFRSSLFELVHEELAGIDEIRIVCNSDLDPRDLSVAKSAQDQANALKEAWCTRGPEVESLLARDRYQRLHDLLVSGNLHVRVVTRDSAAFLHGKAGVIEGRDGTRTAFMGSSNETRQGWREHYEIVWEDDSPEAIAWVDEEFEFLWALGIPLPQVILDEVDRCAHRVEYRSVEECPTEELPAAAMAEAPLYARGESLLPWQQAFVGMFMEHRETYGSVRLLLADEVGLGKTLSLATSAVMASLLGDGPVLILCPATLSLQWQVELWDKLAVPSAVWTRRKTWLDHTGHHIRARYPEDVARCPYQIGIVSTGLIFQDTPERSALLSRSYGTLVLDEAHRARRSAETGRGRGEPNNLLKFACAAAERSRHVLLGTATPIQTNIGELWDLLDLLSRGAQQVLGRQGSPWRDADRVLEMVTGQRNTADEQEAWELLRNPLAPRTEDALFDHIRSDLGIQDRDSFTSRTVVDLEPFTREELAERLATPTSGVTFLQRHNPIVRHTVLRKRSKLEQRGLVPRIPIDIHPSRNEEKPFFAGLALLTNPALDRACAAAAHFTGLLQKRKKSAGFLKSLLEHRICSSLAAGRASAQKLLAKQPQDDEDDETPSDHTDLVADEVDALNDVLEALNERPADPKFEAVRHYLLEGPRWLELGSIVFSQYYDTVLWIAERLAEQIPQEPIAVYAGADRSRLLRGTQSNAVDREAIKLAVKRHEIRLVIATDAACEGLNLQTLGTLINVDLPWNPSRLQQRIGRIQRFGQLRTSVDMLNLVYRGTRDEVVYERLSQRMKDRFDVFGALPDVIEDEWIDDVARFDKELADFIVKRRTVNAFDLRYSDRVDPSTAPWEKCANVLSRRELIERLSRGW